MTVIYKCNKCDKEFNQKIDYQRHLKKKKPCFKKVMKDPSFSCDQCNKSFNNKSNLNRHKHKFCKEPINTNINKKVINEIENENNILMHLVLKMFYHNSRKYFLFYF